MKFTRKLNYDEIRKLSKEEDVLYHKWLSDQNKKEEEEIKKNWTFEDWTNHTYTMNRYLAARRDFFLEEETIDQLVQKRLNGEQEEKFTFFWETKSPFSQWHRSEFTGPTYMWDNDYQKKMIEEGYPKEAVFVSAEQWMMYSKAMLFLDLEVAEKILKTSNPRKIKELGREVRRFEEETWKVYRWRFVLQGNRMKFEQNPQLKKELLATRGTTLVEAAPNDSIWGIGLSEHDDLSKTRSTWKGKNLLGEILTELRIRMDNGNY